MPEVKTGKGIQISKIAKEVNRQSGEVLDYLKRIGIEVGGIMSKVDDSVYHKVLGHFKADMEDAEKHKQKLMDFKKKHKGIEISEIEEDIKKEREKRLQEDEQRQKRLQEEERIRDEREAQIQKDLDEKRRLIKAKEEELEQQKQLEIDLKRKKEEEEKAAEEQKTKKKTEEKEPPETEKAADKKKEEAAAEEEKRKKAAKPIIAEKEAPKEKKPEHKKYEPQRGRSRYEGRKYEGKKPEVKKHEGRFETKKPGEKFEGKKPHSERFETKKPGERFEGKKPGERFEAKKPGERFEAKKPGDRFETKKPGDRFEKKKTEGKFERVTIKEDFRKPKRFIPGKKPFFKKPFVSKADERRREETKTTDVKPPSPDILGRKRDLDKKDKAKKQKYSDGLDAKKRKKIASEEVTQQIEKAIRETMAKMDDAGGTTARAQLRKRKKKERIEFEAKQQQEELARQNILQVTEFLSAGELASLMHIDVSQLITKCFELGMMITINQRLEKDLIILLADEYGFKIEFQKEYEVDILADTEDPPERLVFRPPVVTIMGHVDHGKTSLLDYIRKANVVAGEAGGITQHIGAYQVKTEGNKLITFLDTPGHEAFTAMRARGAQITDIVILVVAADDSVMPQTIEAISHAKAAGVPIIVAINKIDKPNANPDLIRTQLADYGVLVEQWGGKYQSVEISAKSGQQVDQLLEMILLEAEILDLKANPERKARGVVIESKLDKGKGVVATVLVQNGTLRVSDPFVAGAFSGKVRSMFDERGKKMKISGPS